MNRKIAPGVHPLVREMFVLQGTMTDAEFARRSGYSVKFIRNLRGGFTTASLRSLTDMAQALDLRPALVPRVSG